MDQMTRQRQFVRVVGSGSGSRGRESVEKVKLRYLYLFSVFLFRACQIQINGFSRSSTYPEGSASPMYLSITIIQL
jgi:hypothetical protein